MSYNLLFLSFFLIFVFPIATVNAGIYVIHPLSGSLCHGGEPCTVDWLDDGQSPLLSAIGPCSFGLYTGHQQLVQVLQSVDVSSTHAFTFTPNPEAGPNSKGYYVAFTSTSFKENGTMPYIGYSPFFTLDKMNGSSSSLLPSSPLAASSLSTLSLSSSPISTSVISTITIGTLGSSLPSPPSIVRPSIASSSASQFTKTTSRFVTSLLSTRSIVAAQSSIATSIATPLAASVSSSPDQSLSSSIGSTSSSNIGPSPSFQSNSAASLDLSQMLLATVKGTLLAILGLVSL